MTTWNCPPGPGSSLLLGPVGSLVCALSFDSDSETPCSGRSPTGSAVYKGECPRQRTVWHAGV